MIDTRTLLLALSVGNVVLALLLLAFDRSNGLPRAGRVWAAAKFLEGFGFLLFSLRGQTSDVLTILISDTVLFCGFVLEFMATRAYLRLNTRWNMVPVLAAGLLVVFWIAFFTHIAETSRAALFSAMALTILGCTGSAFLLRWQRLTILGQIFGLSYAVITATALVRVGLALTGADLSILSRMSPQTLIVGALYLFMLLNGFGFLMLTQEDVYRQLRRNRERLLHARRLTRVASAEMDLVTGLPLWSSGIPELLGFPPDQVPIDWDAYRALIHPDDRAKVDDSVEIARRGQALEPDEYRIMGGDGTWRWLRREAELLPGKAGQNDAILVTMQDISDRVRMESELREGYASLLRAQRMGRIGSADIDLTTMHVTWSDQLYEIYGRDKADGPADLGEFITYIHSEDREIETSIREQYLKGNAAAAHEFRIVRGDGSTRWLHRETEQIRDASGKPVRLLTVEQDVTDRKLMEAELRHSRDRLILAQRIGRIGSAEFDLRSGTVARSDEYHRLLGLDPMRGPYEADAIVAAMHPDDRATVAAIIQRMMVGEDVDSIDVRAQHPDGTIIWLKRHQEFLRDADGRKYLAIVTLQDITAQMELDQAKDEFLSTVSHELRTPLTSIRGALALVTASVAGTVPEKVSHLLEVATRNSERLTRLVDDILDVQRIQAGRMIYYLADVNITPLVEDAIEANRPMGSKNGVEIALVSPLPGARVHGDAERLMQVLANLLSNAIKFSKPGQTVEVSVERRTPWIRITVTDHGEGIPEAFREKMFKRFSQSDSSDTRRKGGSGLGLSIVEAIISHHQGRISFDTEMGVGTRFHVDLKEVGSGEAAAEPSRAVG